MNDDKTRISKRFASADVGTQLSGIYELDERVAAGGMGEVYRGHNIQTGDNVAIKIVLPEFAHDQTILSLFRKEASILNHLSHDAVVRYHVFTIDPGIGRPYLAMEFVDGESLFDVLRRGAMPTDEVCRLCHRLTSGLSAVHDAGAIHRDLSPDNIILPGGKVERAKIVDFGIARSETVGGGTLIDGKFAGKYNYVSPEQLGLFGGQVSAQSDIYSLGLVLAAALRGKPIDMSGSQLDVVEKRRTVPDLSDIDMAFRPLLEAMLQPLPANRPQSMAEIARMTRDGVVDAGNTLPPAMRREPDADGNQGTGASLPPTSQPPVLPGAGDRSRPPASAVGTGFVAHVRPSHRATGRPEAPAAVETAPAGAKSGRTMGLAAAAAALIVVAGGAGAYFGGLIGPSAPPAPEAGASAALTPAPEAPPGEPAPPPAQASQASEAADAATVAPNAPATTASPAEPAAAEAEPPPAPAQPETSAAARLAEALAQKPESEAKGNPPDQGEKAAPASSVPVEARQDTATAAPSEAPTQPATSANAPEAAPEARGAQPAAPAPAAPVANDTQATPAPVVETPQIETAAGSTPPSTGEASAQDGARSTADVQRKPDSPPEPAENTATAPQQLEPPPTRQKTAEAAPPIERAEPTPPPTGEAPAQDSARSAAEVRQEPASPPQPSESAATALQPVEPPPVQQKTAEATPPPLKQAAPPSPEVQPTPEAQAGTPATSEENPEQVVAMTIPKPEVPAGGAIDAVAQRISWLRAYEGGNCFYASAVAATDKSIEIEGFGTAVDPFARLESAFEAKFHLEPEIDVRLIEPAQCQVADFLGSLSAGRAERPELVLDRTSIPDGSALSGVLRTEPGLKSTMLLIDHKGMAFNLDDRVVVAANQASFNIPIGLAASDKALGKAVPQVVLVVTGPRALDAADFSASVRADEVLPRILAEIREKGGAYSATAKYFRLGG